MGAIAQGRCGGLLALAKIVGAVLGGGEGHGVYALMGAIAVGLVGGEAAGAPVDGLAALEFDGSGFSGGYYGLGHGICLVGGQS
jgi:hypothetical protein